MNVYNKGPNPSEKDPTSPTKAPLTLSYLLALVKFIRLEPHAASLPFPPICLRSSLIPLSHNNPQVGKYGRTMVHQRWPILIAETCESAPLHDKRGFHRCRRFVLKILEWENIPNYLNGPKVVTRVLLGKRQEAESEKEMWWEKQRFQQCNCWKEDVVQGTH